MLRSPLIAYSAARHLVLNSSLRECRNVGIPRNPTCHNGIHTHRYRLDPSGYWNSHLGMVREYSLSHSGGPQTLERRSPTQRTPCRLEVGEPATRACEQGCGARCGDEGTTARRAQGEARRRHARAGGRGARTSAAGSTGRGYHVVLVPSGAPRRTGRCGAHHGLDDAREHDAQHG